MVLSVEYMMYWPLKENPQVLTAVAVSREAIVLPAERGPQVIIYKHVLYRGKQVINYKHILYIVIPQSSVICIFTLPAFSGENFWF